MYERVYLRYPDLSKNLLVFVCDDDLWKVEFTPGKYSDLAPERSKKVKNPPLSCIRLTTSSAQVKTPKISPDGKLIAYVSNESGEDDVYLISSHGGITRRITFKGQMVLVGWNEAGNVLVSVGPRSCAMCRLHEISPQGDEISQRNLGNVYYYKAHSSGEVVGRNLHDIAHWKNYRGGRVGEIWSKQHKKKGGFKRILSEADCDIGYIAVEGPWIYYITDESGWGNVHRSDFSGLKRQQVSFQKDFYVRDFAVCDGHIVYQAAGSLYLQLPGERKAHRLDVAIHSSFNQLEPRFINASSALHDYECSYQGSWVAVIIRGFLYVMKPWVGDTKKLDCEGIYGRFRLVRSFGKERDFLAVAVDHQGADCLIWCQWSSKENRYNLSSLLTKDIGKIHDFKSASNQKFVLISTFKNELWLLKINKKASVLQRIAESDWIIQGFDISYDFSYVAYSKCTRNISSIWTYHLPSRASRPLLRTYGHDVQPTFDPVEPLLYFLSVRSLAPVHSDTSADGYAFYGNIKPYVVHLSGSVASLLQRPLELPLEEEEEQTTEKQKSSDEQSGKKATATEKTSQESSKKQKKAEKKAQQKKLVVDWEDIDHRIEALPFAPGGWQWISVKEDKIFLFRGAFSHSSDDGLNEDSASSLQHVRAYSYLKNSGQKATHGVVHDAVLSGNGKYFIYRMDDGLYLSSSEDKSLGGQEEDKHGTTPPKRKIDLSRIRCLIDPGREWEQMLVEAWQLQRDHFNNPQEKPDFNKILQSYRTLLPQVKTRSEFSDVMYDMQGSLRTSHCYELYGDYFKKPSNRPAARIGADLSYLAHRRCYRIECIWQGESWHKSSRSPLLAPQVGLKVGDEIYEVDGQDFSRSSSLERYLDNRGGTTMEFKVKRKGKKKFERCLISIPLLTFLPYYHWCHTNRELVRHLSEDRIGYLHITAMDTFGLTQFYKHFLVERSYEALIVDVRDNGGGHVSGTIISQLMCKAIAKHQGRWERHSHAYPENSAPQHMVCLINAQCGSDGDIFAQAFKTLKLGPLVGTRTWGGTIGMHSKITLVDGTVTTQPELEFVFHKDSLRLENRGVEPDVLVQITPDDAARSHDTQLIEAVKILQQKVSQQASKPTQKKHQKKKSATNSKAQKKTQ